MKKFIRPVLYAAIGAILGYSYYYFVGCSNGGSCPLTSRWYITTAYGLIAGILMAFPGKNNKQAKQDSNNAGS